MYSYTLGKDVVKAVWVWVGVRGRATDGLKMGPATAVVGVERVNNCDTRCNYSLLLIVEEVATTASSYHYYCNPPIKIYLLYSTYCSWIETAKLIFG